MLGKLPKPNLSRDSRTDLHGQQLLHVHGADRVEAAVEELVVADLVHLLGGVKGVPEDRLRSVAAEMADGAARAVDAVVFSGSAARRRHGVRESCKVKHIQR